MTLSTVTYPKARKKHYCDGKEYVQNALGMFICKCTHIQKGDIYFRNIHKTDGEFMTYKCCLTCRKLINEHKIDDTYDGNC
jgi:hypothetical protein